MSQDELEKLVVTLEEEMYVAAEELRFEYAAKPSATRTRPRWKTGRASPVRHGAEQRWWWEHDRASYSGAALASLVSHVVSCAWRTTPSW